MLLLNILWNVLEIGINDFNTSYVVIKLGALVIGTIYGLHFNTSYVVIKPNKKSLDYFDLGYFNTSYVVIKPLVNKPFYTFYYTSKPISINTFLLFYQMILLFYNC